MNRIYDMDEILPSEEELSAAKQEAEKLLNRWKKRAFYSTGAFFGCCASVTPFLYGHPLHVYWNSFGKYLLLLSMALLIPFIYCVGIAINSWVYLRNLRKIDAESF
jgi:hypothetical protein